MDGAVIESLTKFTSSEETFKESLTRISADHACTSSSRLNINSLLENEKLIQLLQLENTNIGNTFTTRVIFVYGNSIKVSHVVLSIVAFNLS